MKKKYFLVFCPIFVFPLALRPSKVIQMKLELSRPFYARTIPLVIISALSMLFLVIVAQLFYRWWQLRYVFCSECKTRNSQNNELCVKCRARLKSPSLTEEQKRWFKAFGWTKNPFILNTIPDTHIGRQAEILLIIEKINTLSGHILIIGGIGIGKTILLHWLEKHLKDKYETIYVLRPPKYPDELINSVSLAVTKKTFRGSKRISHDIDKFYELCKKSQKKTLILLDEVQELQKELIQFLSVLVELPNVFLIMAGQSQAREMIKHDMPAFFDHIVETVFLGALTRNETEELVMKRIIDAGGKKTGPFTPQAIEEIHSLGYGVPLRILKICDWAVANAVRSNKLTIDCPDIKAYLPEKPGG